MKEMKSMFSHIGESELSKVSGRKLDFEENENLWIEKIDGIQDSMKSLCKEYDIQLKGRHLHETKFVRPGKAREFTKLEEFSKFASEFLDGLSLTFKRELKEKSKLIDPIKYEELKIECGAYKNRLKLLESK